jgi:hypothetical protein
MTLRVPHDTEYHEREGEAEDRVGDLDAPAGRRVRLSDLQSPGVTSSPISKAGPLRVLQLPRLVLFVTL